MAKMEICKMHRWLKWADKSRAATSWYVDMRDSYALDVAIQNSVDAVVDNTKTFNTKLCVFAP